MYEDLLARLETASCGGTVNVFAQSADAIRALIARVEAAEGERDEARDDYKRESDQHDQTVRELRLLQRVYRGTLDDMNALVPVAALAPQSPKPQGETE
jgi:hypothetical protein